MTTRYERVTSAGGNAKGTKGHQGSPGPSADARMVLSLAEIVFRLPGAGCQAPPTLFLLRRALHSYLRLVSCDKTSQENLPVVRFMEKGLLEGPFRGLLVRFLILPSTLVRISRFLGRRTCKSTGRCAFIGAIQEPDIGIVNSMDPPYLNTANPRSCTPLVHCC